ncbi:alpha/beta hydrolase [Streptomyces sp. NPDC048604]|uniref:alpha/beta hydrolase n=1 Tax=Streptomyces sp. NPDC048604 TaxID=3365578 RepID=UPI00371C158E
MGSEGVPQVDPELAAGLGEGGRVRITPENLAEVQRRDVQVRPRPSVEELRADGRFEVEELRAGDVTLVAGRPAGTAGPLPVLYYMHGGGMVMGNARSVMPRLLDEWAQPLGLAVVSVEYRLAPQAQYPESQEDCYAGLLATADRADALGIDPDRIVLGGKSAGGGLAASLALLTRDRGGPAPIGQLLLCPMLDDRAERHSAHQMDGIDTVDRTTLRTIWRATLGDDLYGTADIPPYAAPGRATDLSALPPAYLDVGAAELLRDDTVAYADALWRAGGDAELHVWPGAFHGFDTIVPKAAVSLDALEARTRWLRRILAR